MEKVSCVEYNKALKVLQDFPNALKIIEQYCNENNIKSQATHINLQGILSVKSINIIRDYFNYFHTDLKFSLNNFPLENLFKIDVKKLIRVRQCGKKTFGEITEFIAECKTKYK